MSDRDLMDDILSLNHNISLAKALDFADRWDLWSVSIKPDFTTHDGLVAYCRKNDEIQAEIAGGRKIMAIKHLREHASNAGVSVGLRDAKDAVDVLMPPSYMGRNSY